LRADAGAREPAIERLIRHLTAQDRTHCDQLLGVDGGVEALALAWEHQILEHHVAEPAQNGNVTSYLISFRMTLVRT
jgi:hypothetical protein